MSGRCGATLLTMRDVSVRCATPAPRMLKWRISQVCVVALVAALAVAGGTAASAAGRCASPPGPGVDWHGCDLHGRNLGNADLRRANLSDANLSHAMLSGAKLAHATLTRASLTGAKLDSVS